MSVCQEWGEAIVTQVIYCHMIMLHIVQDTPTPLENDSINAVLTVDGKQLQEANCFYSRSRVIAGVW